MKKLLIAVMATIALGAHAQQNESQSYKLITVSTYLNFYLMNLNACEDFHPSTRRAAYEAEGKLYPYFEKLEAKISNIDIDKKDMQAIKNTVTDRRGKLNDQIKDQEFTIEHCNAVIGLVNDGLDEALLSALN